MSENYIDLAKDKFRQSKEVHWENDLKQFVCECYCKLNPCSYGIRVAEKVRLMLDVFSVNQRDGRGDIVFNNIFYEQKVSYLSNVNNSWSLTHLRPWQKFNYYIICLVDCEENFNVDFYVIDKMTINKFNLTAMNGTLSSNHNNSNVEMRTSIVKNSEAHSVLKKNNKLKNTSFESLKSFILSK